MADPTQFDRDSAARIARVVRTVEEQRPTSKPLSFEPAMPPVKVVRFGKFNGPWLHDFDKTVRLGNTTQTVSVVNLVCGIEVSTAATCEVTIARNGTTWQLVQSDWTKYEGYATAGTHSLVVSDSKLRWLDVSNARMATFDTTWSHGSTLTISFLNSTSTVAVTNLVAPLAPNTAVGPCEVSVVREGESWYLAQPNWTKQPGYATAGTHALTISEGAMRWTDITPAIRIAQYTGLWVKGVTKNITFSYAPTASISALNLFGDVDGGIGKRCAVAREGTAWYLIAAECN